MNPLAIGMLIANILSEIVPGIPQVPKLVSTILQSVTAGLSALVKSGVTASPVTVSSILGALQAVVESLKAVPNLPQATLAVIADLDLAVQAAVAADKIAQQGVDPTLLNPVSSLPVEVATTSAPPQAVHPAQ